MFIVIGGRVPYIYIYIYLCVMSVSALFPFQRTITTINQQNSMNTLQIPTDSHIRAGIPVGLPYVYIYIHIHIQIHSVFGHGFTGPGQPFPFSRSADSRAWLNDAKVGCHEVMVT